MSNYKTKAINPVTQEIEEVDMLDDYFGRHKYGVRFPNGTVYREEDIQVLMGDDLIQGLGGKV